MVHKLICGEEDFPNNLYRFGFAIIVLSNLASKEYGCINLGQPSC